MKSKALAVSFLGLSLRIMQRWNQTGQKYAGGPDIAKTYLLNHNFILWALVIVTHANIGQRLARTCFLQIPRYIAFGAALILSLAALGFKVAYTNADAPELLIGLHKGLLRPVLKVSLIPQARGVFALIAIAATLSVSSASLHRGTSVSSSGVSSTLLRSTECLSLV